MFWYQKNSIFFLLFKKYNDVTYNAKAREGSTKPRELFFC